MAVDDDDARPAPRVPRKDARLVEQRIDSERVFAGKLLDVRRDRVRLPDGHEATREYIVHPGAVLMVPLLEDGRFVVVRQFRYPNNAVFTEFPAGKLDPGEAPLATAKRELKEETGYTATTWTHLGRIHPVVSYSTEAIELYLAQGLVHVGATLDHGEFLEVEAMQYAELVAAVDRGEITDAKTIAALYHLERRGRGDDICTRRLVVSGRVQGVGFRDTMAGVALQAGVAGWVRNRRDGTVESVVQGAVAAVEEVIDWSRRGPPAARVTSVDVTTVPPDPSLDGFEIRSTP
jgi:ADP-ribose pyrophosphatase